MPRISSALIDISDIFLLVDKIMPKSVGQGVAANWESINVYVGIHGLAQSRGLYIAPNGSRFLVRPGSFTDPCRDHESRRLCNRKRRQRFYRHLSSQPHVKCVQDLGRPFKRDSEIVIAFIAGDLRLVHTQTSREVAL